MKFAHLRHLGVSLFVLMVMAAPAHSQCDELNATCSPNYSVDWQFDQLTPGLDGPNYTPAKSGGGNGVPTPGPADRNFTGWASASPSAEQSRISKLIEDSGRLDFDDTHPAFRFVFGPDGEPIGFAPVNGLDNQPQQLPDHGTQPPSPHSALGSSDPVQANGDFVIDVTDITFAGQGISIPYTFFRYYSSGINYQTPLGFGWSHNYSARVIPATTSYTTPANGTSCQAQIPDVFYVTDKMDQIRFWFDHLSGAKQEVINYTAGPSVPLVLTRNTSESTTPWELDDGSGFTYHFDGTYGNLSSITDLSGHQLSVFWKHDSWEGNGGEIDHVTDAAGRNVYYQYAAIDPKLVESTKYELDPVIGDIRPAYHGGQRSNNLQCITLDSHDTSCQKPLVSFSINPSLVSDVDRPNAEGKPVKAGRKLEFDLTGVRDALGHGPAYGYAPIDLPTYQAAVVQYLPGKEPESFCHFLCDSKEADCHNADLCYQQITLVGHESCDNMDRSAWQAFNWCTMRVKQGNSEEECLGATDNPYGTRKGEPGCCIDKSSNLAARQGYKAGCLAALVTEAWANYPTCRQDSYSTCLASKRAPSPKGGPAYGVPTDLFHNLKTVTDADGRLTIENTYGENPFEPDFDKVNKQVQGSGPDATMTFQYHDLNVEQQFGPPANSDYVVPLASFDSVQLCPGTCVKSVPGGEGLCTQRSGYDKAVRSQRPNSFQLPSYAVVIHDIAGVVRTNYYDSEWRLLREVNNGMPVDRNYVNGALRGIEFPAGDRVCIESGPFAKPQLITRLPADGHDGNAQPQVTQLIYDQAQELLQAIKDPDGPSPAKTQYIRDNQERVTDQGEQVAPNLIDWTRFTYANAVGRRLPTQQGVPDNLLPLTTTKPDGSIISQSQTVPDNRLPLTSTKPDGSIQQSQTPAGNRRQIVIDSAGPDPLHSFVQYDGFGKVTDIIPVDHKSLQPQKGAGLHSSYGADGRPVYTATEDPTTGNLVKTNYTYDASGNVISIVSPSFTRTFNVDALGHLQSFTDAANGAPAPPKGRIANGGTPLASVSLSRSSCFQFDIQGKLLERVYPEGNAERYQYDAWGQLTSVWKGYENHPLPWAVDCNPQIQQNGSMQPVMTYERDAFGWLKHIHQGGGPLGFDTYLVLDGFGRVVDSITPLDSVTIEGRPFYTQARHAVRGYDILGRVAWQAVWGPSFTSYDKPQGLDPLLHAMVEYQYDLLDRVTQVDQWCFTEKPLQDCFAGRHSITSREYDDAHATVTTTDPEGKKSVARLDGAGRLAEATSAQGSGDQQDVAYQYSQRGALVTVTLTPAPTKSGQLVRTHTYDAHGNLTAIVEAGRPLLSQTYNSLDQPVGQVALGMGEVLTSFDAFGRFFAQSYQTDSSAMGRTVHQYDGNDRLVKVVDPAGHTTTMTYDGLDNIATVTNGIGVTTYSYLWGTNRLFSSDDPAQTHREFSYNPAGELEYEDAKDGLTLGTSGADTLHKFTYTGSGLVYQGIVVGDCRVPDDSIGSPNGSIQGVLPCKTPDVVVTRDYDSLGRIVSEKNSAVPLSIAHSFSPGKTDTQFVRGQAVAATISTTYDNLYRPLQLTLGNQTVASLNYANGAIRSIDHGNKVQDFPSYDERGRLTGVDVRGHGQVIASLHDGLGFDDIPRERQRTFGGRPPLMDLFKADQAGRITAENLQLPAITPDTGDLTNANAADKHWDMQKPWSVYALDGADNWISRTASGGTFTPLPETQINAANQYTEITGNGQPSSVSYDKAGDLIAYVGQKFQFDGQGNLLNAASGASTQTFRYDAFGRRFQESDGVTPTLFVWDGSRLAGSMPGGHPEQARIRIGTGLDGTLALADNLGAGPTYSLHAGVDNSTLAATDDQGSLIEGYRYSSQGDTIVVDPQQGKGGGASKIANRFLFQGQLYDTTLGLYSMRAREYFPAWGRFLSPDPVGLAGGTNLYGFVGGKALTHWDPSGLSEKRTGGVSVQDYYAALVDDLSADYDRDHPLWHAPRPVKTEVRLLEGLMTDLNYSSSTRMGAALRFQQLLTGGGVAIPLEYIIAGITETAVQGYQNYEKGEFVQHELAKQGLEMFVPAVPGEDSDILIPGTPWGSRGIQQIAQTVTSIPTGRAPPGALLEDSSKGAAAVIAGGAGAASVEKGQIGGQMTVARAFAQGINLESPSGLLREEISYRNLVTGVEGRMDYVGTVPELPTDHLIGLESKAGRNAGFTSGQALNAPWMESGFAPVQFFGPNAVKAGLDLTQVYYMNMVRYNWFF